MGFTADTSLEDEKKRRKKALDTLNEGLSGLQKKEAPSSNRDVINEPGATENRASSVNSSKVDVQKEKKRRKKLRSIIPQNENMIA